MLRLIGVRGESSMELGLHALNFIHLALSNAPSAMLRTHSMFAPLRDPAAGIAERLVQLGAGNRPFHQRCLSISREWRRVVQEGAASASAIASASSDLQFHNMHLQSLNFGASVLKCALCGREDGKLSKCSRCERERYCGAACQRAHWKAHKKVCVAKPE